MFISSAVSSAALAFAVLYFLHSYRKRRDSIKLRRSGKVVNNKRSWPVLKFLLNS